MEMWHHRQESNLYLALRRRSFYPLNYGGKNGEVEPLRCDCAHYAAANRFCRARQGEKRMRKHTRQGEGPGLCIGESDEA